MIYLIVILLLAVIVIYYHDPRRSPSLPLIGNIHQLPQESPWRTYAQWSKQYGPIFSLRLGLATIVILGNHEAARDLLDNGLLVRKAPKPGTRPRIGHGVPSPLDTAINQPIPSSSSATSLFVCDLFLCCPRHLPTAPLLTALLAGPGFERPDSLAAVPPPDPFNHLFLIRSTIVTLSRRRPATDGDVDGVPEPTCQRPPANATPLDLHHFSLIATYN